MRSFTARAIADGKRVAALCVPRSYTKLQIQVQLALSSHRTQEAIDWCKQQRLITRNPFYAVIENGKWTYGYRSTLTEVVEHNTFNLGYCGTRLSNVVADMEHELLTTAALAKRITPKQRATMAADLTMLRGAVATISRVSSDVISLLKP